MNTDLFFGCWLLAGAAYFYWLGCAHARLRARRPRARELDTRGRLLTLDPEFFK
jgi:hypothetical protein